MAPPPVPTIAATSTLAMVRTAASRGAQTTDLLKGAGLTLAMLEDPDARLAAPTVLGIWNALRERTGDPCLQLAAPATLPWGAYRVIDYLVAASATVGEGIEQFARYFGLIAEQVSLRVAATRGEHVLVLARSDGSAVPPVYVDYVFAALVTRMRMRIHPQIQVRRMEFRQPRPASTPPYAAVFGDGVRFGAAADRLCLDDAEWHAPVVTADAALARLLEEHARMLAARAPQAAGFAAVVQQAIVAAPQESGSAPHVARALNVSVRTLQRRLIASGTTFREVSDRVRSHLAEGYLGDRAVSISEVAFLLGFSEQSSFNRAFRRWTGESPSRWRKQVVPR